MAKAAKIRPPLSLGERRDLIEAHLYRVPLIASRMLRRMPRWVEKAELIGVGNLRLVECSSRFDESRGVSFGWFASLNIEGAMRDWCRSQDLLTRNERRGGETYERSKVDLKAAHDVYAREGRPSEIETHCDLEVLLAVIHPRYRYAVEQYFLVGRNMKSVAGDLHVNESRVCQIVKQAVETMRAAVHPSEAVQ